MKFGVTVVPRISDWLMFVDLDDFNMFTVGANYKF